MARAVKDKWFCEITLRTVHNSWFVLVIKFFCIIYYYYTPSGIKLAKNFMSSFLVLYIFWFFSCVFLVICYMLWVNSDIPGKHSTNVYSFWITKINLLLNWMFLLIKHFFNLFYLFLFIINLITSVFILLRRSVESSLTYDGLRPL